MIMKCVRYAKLILNPVQSKVRQLKIQYGFSGDIYQNRYLSLRVNAQSEIEFSASKLRRQGIELTPFQKSQLPSYVNFLTSKLGGTRSDTLNVIVSSAGVLLNINFLNFESAVAFLRNSYLVNSTDLMQILSHNPTWLYRPLSDIEAVLQRLCAQGIRLNETGKVLSKYPRILFMDAEEFDQRLEFFGENEFTTKEVRMILLSYPEILANNHLVLEKIYQYVTQTFNMTHEEMVQSILFKYKYSHVFLRFEFLRKRGLYVGRDKRGVYPANRQAAPRKIISHSDIAFLSEIAFSTEEEFKNFFQSLSPELQKEVKYYDSLFENQEPEQDGRFDLELTSTEDDDIENKPDNEDDIFEDRLWKYLKQKYTK